MNNIITIATPSFNQGKFLEQTISSVLSQQGNFFIDYIIADGGSNDESVEIIKKYDALLKTKKYPIKCLGIELRWWSHRDTGQTNAINKGFKLAKGDILAWINSDDYYEKNIFQTVIDAFQKNEAIDLLYGDIYFLDEVNHTKIFKKTEQGDYNLFTGKGFYIYQPTTFFKKKSAEKAGYLEENLHYSFDYDFFLKLLKNGGTLYLPVILANFRIWENSKTYSQQKNFDAENKLIRKKYGLNIIGRKKIYNLTAKQPFSFFREHFPVFYKLIKKIFYFFFNKLRYK